MAGNPHYVQYWATPHGYAVTAYDAESQPVEEYRAGNHEGDSQAWIAPDSLGAINRAQLVLWARREALDTAKRLGVPVERVTYDADGEADELAMRAEFEYPD